MASSRRIALVPVTAGCLIAALLAQSGCGPSGGGPSDNDLRMQAIEQGAEGLRKAGAKVDARHYPQGEAWAVNLSGMTVTDDLIRAVKQLGNVTELDLSKSTVTDEQLGLINELGLPVLLLKLDLGNTAVTDAGFEKLDNMRLLSQLNLTGTKVSKAAVERFKKQRQSDPRIPDMFKHPTIRL